MPKVLSITNFILWLFWETRIEIDACFYWPCFAKNVQECKDLPPPAPNSPYGRECVCEEGFENYVEGQGCSDVSVCESNLFNEITHYFSVVITFKGMFYFE